MKGRIQLDWHIFHFEVGVSYVEIVWPKAIDCLEVGDFFILVLRMIVLIVGVLYHGWKSVSMLRVECSIPG